MISELARIPNYVHELKNKQYSANCINDLFVIADVKTLHFSLSNCTVNIVNIYMIILLQVDPSTVASAEAYVLFYRKSGEQLEPLRRELASLELERNDSLVKYYVSNPWLVKLRNMAEPGQIDNSSVLCRHGGVLPQRIEAADRLCTPLPPAAWRLLYDRSVQCDL